MEITTVIGCRNMCSYCPQKNIISAYKSKDLVMSFNTFKKCIDKIPKNVKIVFAGMAEPFQNKDCMKMILYASKKGFTIEIFTTSIGVKEKDIKELEKININYFDFHLPDNSGSTHIKVDSSLLKVVKAISESKIKNIHYQVFGKVHPEVQKVLNFNVEDLSRLLQNRAGNLDVGFKPQKLKGKIICSSTGRKLDNNVLLPNGDVILCCMDYGLECKIGNLLESSYEELFKTNAFKKIQRSLDNGSEDFLCRNCSYARRTDSIKYKVRKNLDKLGVTKKVYDLTKYKPVKKVYIYLKNKIN